MNRLPTRFPCLKRLLLLLLATVSGLWSGTAAEQKLDVPSLENEISIGYLTDVPARWMVADENPMEAWARACNDAWSRRAAARSDAMFEAESRESLDEALIRGRAAVVPMYAYEWLVRKAEAAQAQRSAMAGRGSGTILELEPLAVVVEESASGELGLTEFVIVSNARNPVLQFLDLKDKTVLEHGSQWGDLVGYWLDWQVQLIEGAPNRKLWGKSKFKRAASAQQAMLAVYFGEADACVVTRAEYEMVLTHNPEGLRRRLNVFPEKRAEDRSNQFPGILLVARTGSGGLRQERKDEIRKRVEGISRVFPSGTARLQKCTESTLEPALKPLEDLMEKVIRSRLTSSEPDTASPADVHKLSSEIGAGTSRALRADPERRRE